MTTAALEQDVVALRRDFHRHPELGFCEYRTASLTARRLDDLGWETRTGADAIVPGERLGVPPTPALDAAYAEALDRGADERYAKSMRGGLTAVVATLEGAHPGPRIALRFDMDALPVHESEAPEHRPAHLGFRSTAAGTMHACAHDGHTAIGLALAGLLADRAFAGTVTLLFQPAEEGGRGGRAMAAHPALVQPDLFVALHLGLGVPGGTVAAQARGLLANRKFRARLGGRAAHAASQPQLGRNALLGAATAVLGIHGIGSVAGSDTRVNVGRLEAGTVPNIIPDQAQLDFELRADSEDAVGHLEARARSIVDGAARAYELTAELEPIGAVRTARPTEAATAHVTRSAHRAGLRVVPDHYMGASDDATEFLRTCLANGGDGTYSIVGADLHGPHHTAGFDFDESALSPAVRLLDELVRRSDELPPRDRPPIRRGTR